MGFIDFMNKWFNLPLSAPSFPRKLGKIKKKNYYTNKKLVQIWHKVINLEIPVVETCFLLKTIIWILVIPTFSPFFQTKGILKCFIKMALYLY